MNAKYQVGDKFKIQLYRHDFNGNRMPINSYRIMAITDVMTHDEDGCPFDEPQYFLSEYDGYNGASLGESNLGEKIKE
jgi:hypothetical protein